MEEKSLPNTNTDIKRHLSEWYYPLKYDIPMVQSESPIKQRKKRKIDEDDQTNQIIFC